MEAHRFNNCAFSFRYELHNAATDLVAPPHAAYACAAANVAAAMRSPAKYRSLPLPPRPPAAHAFYAALSWRHAVTPRFRAERRGSREPR